MALNRQQLIVIFGGLAAVTSLYFLGPTVAPDKPAPATASTPHTNASFNIETFEREAIAGLSTERQRLLAQIKAEVKRGDVKDQQVHADHQLARFWKDSVPNPVLHFYFVSRAAGLENNEKSLTFAAHSILGYLPYAPPAQKSWLASKGKELFEKALELNPSNDSTIVGMGGCIIYGAAAGEDAMQGILKIRAVADRDSTNLFAQYMLGMGGMVSQQYDKAAARFEKVVKGQPDNLEAMFKLAEANELMGNKSSAVHWYEVIAGKVSDPQMQTAIAQRIRELNE